MKKVNGVRGSIAVILSLVFVMAATGLCGQGAQEGAALKNKVKIMVGGGLPVGDFSSTSLTLATAGFAKTGFSIAGEFSTQVQRGFELGLMGYFSSHSIADDEMKKQFVALLSQLGVNASNVSLTTSSWQLIGATGSVGFSVEASPDVDFYGKGFVGALFGKSPELTASVDTIQASQASATGTAFGFGAGVGIIVSKNFDLSLRFLAGEPEYEGTVQVNGSTMPVKGKQPSSTVQLMVGYVFTF